MSLDGLQREQLPPLHPDGPHHGTQQTEKPISMCSSQSPEKDNTYDVTCSMRSYKQPMQPFV